MDNLIEWRRVTAAGNNKLVTEKKVGENESRRLVSPLIF